MQRNARSVSQKLSTCCYRALESFKVCVQFLAAARVQVELLLYRGRRFRKQRGRIDGIRVFELLPQVALYPWEIVLEDLGIIGLGCECFQ